MSRTSSRSRCLAAAWALGLSSCLPSGDLDQHARGSATRPATPVGAESTTLEPLGPLAPGGSAAPGESQVGALAPLAAPPPPTPAPDNGVPALDAGALAADATVPPPGTVVEPPPFAAALPDDLLDAPVSGEIVFSDDAEWEVDGVFEPTFEIHTPTASYWIVKPLGTMVSLEDRETAFAQWISFSSGFRPLRGVPALEVPPATRVTTVRDEGSQTPTHVRLTSVSLDGAWQWVWDFYVTHVTLTVNRAPGSIGFNYRGVPGGSLGQEDRLVLSDGTSQGARNSFNGELLGPSEWAYIADTTLARSIFLIQHSDDALAERYQVRDNDSAFFSFGNGLIQTLPLRFSLGLIASANHVDVSTRAEFVTRAITGK